MCSALRLLARPIVLSLLQLCFQTAVSLNGQALQGYGDCWHLTASCQFIRGKSQVVAVGNCGVLNTFRVFSVAVGCATSALFLASFIQSIFILIKRQVLWRWFRVGVIVLAVTGETYHRSRAATHPAFTTPAYNCSPFALSLNCLHISLVSGLHCQFRCRSLCWCCVIIWSSPHHSLRALVMVAQTQ